jgi:hypothetical protein
MDTAPSRPARRYESRPGRLVLVIDDLNELQGPLGGIVELPNRLLWQPNRTVDLDDAWARRWMYALVLREARSRDDLRTFLSAQLLLPLWQRLNLPRAVRAAWQDRHPELRPHAAAA